MDSSNSSSSHPVKAKLTLLDWFERSRKGQRADGEVQRTNLNDDSSEDPAGCPHWSGEPGELVVETLLAKRVRGDHADDCIAIDSDSASSEDEPIAFLQHDLDSPTNVAISKNGVCHLAPFSEIETPTMLSTSINTDFLVSRQSGVKESA